MTDVTTAESKHPHHQFDRMRLPIRYKIILPFSVLLVFVGAVGTAVATARMTSAASTEFDATLLHSSLLANQSLGQLEVDRVAQLRAASNTVGVPEALLAQDRTALSKLLTPIAVNAQPTDLVVKVLDTNGATLTTAFGNPRDASLSPVAEPADFTRLAALRNVLAGRADAYGDRYVALVGDEQGTMLYWVGPVTTDSGKLAGAIAVGQKLTGIVQRVPGSALYGLDGRLLTSSTRNPIALDTATARRITSQNAVPVDANQAGHGSRALFSQWIMRGLPIGYLAVQASTDQLESAVTQTRLLLASIFTAAALLTLLVGAMAAALITRPIDRLVRSMRVVAAGDLRHRAAIVSGDEVGFLAETFNEMASSLQEKTAALEDSYFGSMEALARAIDARDPSTFGHSARVAAISVEIAAEMGMPSAEVEALRRGALLHDIGKIGIEDRVLRKPGPLSSEEMKAMKEHPRVGYEMLKDLHFLEPSLPGVLHHHERWDGAGYPHGLSGKQIPLAVRILTLADVFEALTSDRHYRTAMNLGAAVDVIRNEAGLRFDPDVVSAFLRRQGSIVSLLKTMSRASSGEMPLAEVA